MNERMTKNLVSQSLFHGVEAKCPPCGQILHSDRGCQHCAHEHQQLIDQFGMVASMSHRGNCYGNTPKERFWGCSKMNGYITVV